MRVFVTVKEVRRETDDCFTLIFEKHPVFSSYQSGQFINVECIIKGNIVNRLYSISSSPFQGELPAITIKKVEGGVMSNHLWEQAKEGYPLSVGLPNGRFISDFSSENNNILMIAGGSGITPIFSILKSTLIQNPAAQITLLYSSKNQSQVIFDCSLRLLQKMYSHRLTITYFITEEIYGDPPSEIKMVFGRISETHLQEFILGADIEPKKVETFICGPDQLMILCLNSLTRLGLIQDKIHLEYFTLNRIIENESNQTQTTSYVTLKRKGDEKFSFRVPKGEPILKSGISLGFQLPHSCLAAMCGTCKARIVNGQVKMSKNYSLTDSELERGYVLLCSGSAETDVVELEYD